MGWTRCLLAVEQNEIAQVGGKATNPGILTRADLPVPAGFVIVTSAYA